MPAVDWSSLLLRTHRNCSACASCPHKAPAVKAPGRWLPVVHRTVWALGFTSLLTDVSSEMVASILPVYLVLQLGVSPLAFGVVDGLYQGAAALVRVVGGVLADRWKRHKELAAFGYGLSALCRLAIFAVGSGWGAIAGIVAADRIGKGIRTAPRDALISLRTPCRELGTAFGVHRALDAAGAMLGPVCAFVLLAAMPGSFDVLFLASFAVAVLGVAVIVLFVDENGRNRARRSEPVVASRALFADPRFRAILVAGLVLSLPTMSDSFIFLSLQQRLAIPAMAFPLFYVMTSLFTALGSVPLGKAADRFGRTRVLLFGYVLLGVVYGSLMIPAGPRWTALLPLSLLGAYYAATDGVLTAMAAAVLPAEASASGLAVLATVTNVGRVAASVLFGFAWMRMGLGGATALYLGALAVGLSAAAVVLTRGVPAGADQPAASAAG